MELEDLRVYKLSMELGEIVYRTVEGWSYFDKDTVGKQIVRSADSVAANISEGFGRYFYKETIKFAYYSRGSLYETKTFAQKAHSRNLMSDAEHEKLVEMIEQIGKMLNSYINSLYKLVDQNEKNKK
jgi:four helix bundle protein